MIRRSISILFFFAVTYSLAGCAPPPMSYDPYSPLAQMARSNANLGLQFLHHGYTNLAQEHLQLAYQINPHDALILDSLAFYFEKTGNLRTANHYYSSAIKRFPDAAVAYNSYGAFLCRNSYYKRSLPYFTVAARKGLYSALAKQAITNLNYCEAKANGQLDKSMATTFY